jgi:hypothetical protein
MAWAFGDDPQSLNPQKVTCRDLKTNHTVLGRTSGREKECIIVCWTDDWPSCPLEVIELKGLN